MKDRCNGHRDWKNCGFYKNLLKEIAEKQKYYAKKKRLML
jgi:hypothetical protein